MTDRIDTDIQFFGEHIHREAHRRGATPFLMLADRAGTAAMGIDVLIGLLRQDAIGRAFEDSGPLLDDRQIDALLGLAQVSARMLVDDVASTRDWADKYFVQEGSK